MLTTLKNAMTRLIRAAISDTFTNRRMQSGAL